jgi:phospho-N-acetylmuramoyl-pentapeptide-transferase
VLYYLEELGGGTAVFGVLRHAPVRAALATVVAFATALVFGRWFIAWLRSRQVLEVTERGDSEKLDELQRSKKNTPTLGGGIILVASVAATLACARLDNRLLVLAVLATLLFAALGLADDLKKLRSRRRGLSARAKFFWQLVLGASVAWYLEAAPLGVESPELPAGSDGATALFFPVPASFAVSMGSLYVVVVVALLAATTNAVNLTDGLDGLAIGCTAPALTLFAVLGLCSGSADASSFLRLPYIQGLEEVGVFASSLVGAGAGFLWFNCHPAQIIMGDTGSLALGAALGLLAILSKQEVLVVLAGGVLMAEAASVVVQVSSYKLRRKRVFLCSPLHHHFQFKGWPETKITVRFWLVAVLLAFSSAVALGVRSW